MNRTKFLIAAGIFLSVHVFAQQAAPLKLIKTFQIGGEGGWDYLAVHPSNNMLYVSHGTRVNVLNKTTGEPVATIEGTDGVHGIAFNANKGFISCGRLNLVKVFDTKTNKVSSEIQTGKNPDAIFYELYSKKIITCNGGSKDLSVIDPQTNQVVQTIDVGGKPETAVSDGKGKIFVNIEDKNEIVAIDAKQFKIISHWGLDKEEGPSGLAIDVNTNRLFSTCDKMLVIMDTRTGKVIQKLPIGDGTDGDVFDSQSKNIYTSNRAGTISVIHENNANQFTAQKDIITKKGARTIALDEKTHCLYLPTADFNEKETDSRGRPKIVAGSFQVLVFGK